MSSAFVRNTITTFITTELVSEKLADMTTAFDELDIFLARNSITRNDAWLGLQFVGGDEIPVSLNANGDNAGKYRETGVIFLHVVDVAKVGSYASLLSRCETIRSKFRGKNISGIRIESVTTPDFNASGTLQFEGGWTSASILISYEYDINL